MSLNKVELEVNNIVFIKLNQLPQAEISWSSTFHKTDSTYFMKKKVQFNLECLYSKINYNTLFVLDGLATRSLLTPQTWTLKAWANNLRRTREADRPRCFEQRKIYSMPCIIWVCRVLLCQGQGGQGGSGAGWDLTCQGSLTSDRNESVLAEIISMDLEM